MICWIRTRLLIRWRLRIAPKVDEPFFPPLGDDSITESARPTSFQHPFGPIFSRWSGSWRKWDRIYICHLLPGSFPVKLVKPLDPGTPDYLWTMMGNIFAASFWRVMAFG